MCERVRERKERQLEQQTNKQLLKLSVWMVVCLSAACNTTACRSQFTAQTVDTDVGPSTTVSCLTTWLRDARRSFTLATRLDYVRLEKSSIIIHYNITVSPTSSKNEWTNKWRNELILISSRSTIFSHLNTRNLLELTVISPGCWCCVIRLIESLLKRGSCPESVGTVSGLEGCKYLWRFDCRSRPRSICSVACTCAVWSFIK